MRGLFDNGSAQKALRRGNARRASLPIAVEYLQYVLADVTGLLFATFVIGLARPSDAIPIVAMAALAGLAAASKLHYGLWLLTPILCIWLRKDDDDQNTSCY